MAREAAYESSESEVIKVREEQKQILDALQMLFDLLEKFAPCWYTEEHHEQALAALALAGSHNLRHTVLAKGNSLECNAK
jgi:hypothetical protein